MINKIKIRNNTSCDANFGWLKCYMQSLICFLEYFIDLRVPFQHT